MGRLEGRIRRLEAQLEVHADAVELTEEARRQREWAEVLIRLSDEDLRALIETGDAAIERVEPSGALVDLREAANERGRQALDRFEHALAALRRGDGVLLPKKGDQSCPTKGRG